MKHALTALAALAFAPLAVSHAAESIDVGSRRELFVDKHLVGRLDGTRLVLHRPQPREVALECDQPWEGQAPGYVTVFQDGKLYRMYYRAIPDGPGRPDDRLVTCYAESKDGIHWTRPELGIVEFKGSKNNNVLVKGLVSHNFTPWKEGRPDCPVEARYKAVGGPFGGPLRVFQSSDGIRWKPAGHLPLQGNFDSQNIVLWDSVSRQYRAYWRDHRGGDPKIPDGRDVRTAISRDFINWSKRQWLDYDPGRRGTSERPVDPASAHQFYTSGVQPYRRAPHLLLGFPMRYIDRGWTASTDALPNLERRRELAAKKIGGGRPTRLGTAISDVMFMASRDGRRFFVWPEAIVRPGIQRPGSWFYGSTWIALGMVETESPFDGAPRELSVYITENARQDSPARLRRYAFRMDGFTSVHASLRGGELLTRPLVFTGNRLAINFATSAGGSLRVEIQDEKHKPIPGFALTDCDPHYGDQLDRIVSWKTGADVSRLAGKPVRLRIRLKDADLYSFRFRTEQ